MLREAVSEPVQAEPAQTIRGCAVAGLGVAIPKETVSSAAVADRLGVDEDWIVARTGIRERKVAAADERLADLASAAGRAALADAGIGAEEVDLLLVATMSHETMTPHAAALVAAELGASGAGAIDVNAACSGFVSALTLAASQLESRRAETALVVGADILSRMTDPDDRMTAPLFADGAGAVVLRPGSGRRIGPVTLGADGARADLITAGREESKIRMKGPDTFRQAVDRLSESTLDAVAAAGRGLDEIDLFVFHQANGRILTAVGERLGLDPARVVDCIGSYGNTSAASIPLALGEARRAGTLGPSSSVLLSAFGGGLSWAAAVIDWGEAGDA